MAGGDAAAELRVAGVHAIAVESAGGLLLHRHPDIAPQEVALLRDLLAPALEELLDAADGLVPDHLHGRHGGEVPERIAQVEEDGGDAGHGARMKVTTWRARSTMKTRQPAARQAADWT